MRRLHQALLNWWPAMVLAGIVVIVAAPFWNVPLNRDQGVYATCADLLSQGGVPFVSCWDTKGPLLHYAYLFAFAIFGPAGRSPYVLNTLVIAATTIVLAALTTRLLFDRHLPTWLDLQQTSSLWVAYSVGLIYGLMVVAVRYDMNAQPEGFANLFAVAGLLSLIIAMRRPASNCFFIAAGVLLACAVLFKYALILPFGAAALVLLVTVPIKEKQPAFARMRAFGIVFVTSTLVLLIGVLLLVASGALDVAVTHVYFLFRYFPNAQLNPVEFELRSQPVRQTLQYFGRVPLLYAVGAAGLVWAILQKRWYVLFVGLYLLSAIALVWIQQRFTPYHWIAALPAIAIAVGLFLRESVAQPLPPQSKRVLPAVAIVAVLTNAAWFFYVDQWLIVGPRLTGQQTEQEFHLRQGTWDQIQVAQYITDHTEPGDGLWVWGHHTPIYHLAERYPPTRFIYNEPLLMRIRGGHPYREQWRSEALEAIYESPPEYILLTTFDRTFFDFQNPDVSWSEIEAYRDFTDRYYIRELTIGRFKVYRLSPYYSRQLDARLLDAVTQTDLVAQFPDADVLNQVEPNIRIEPFTVFPEPAYDTILMHSGGALAYNLELSDGINCLRFDATMFPDSWEWGVDGASFAVDVEAGGQTPIRVFERYISNAPEDQGWFSEIVDLSAWSGQNIRLVLSTGPGPNNDFTGDWAGWGQPRIVTPPNNVQACSVNAVYDPR